MTNSKIKTGDKVRVKLASSSELGETIYTVEEIGLNGFDCTIREISNVRKHSLQRFDTSMLKKVG